MIIAGVFAGFSVVNHQPPFDKLALDGQTLASYVAIVLGTTVAGAGSWVAIQIAQAAYVAQQTANRMQQDELRLQDPDETSARTFIARSRALRLTGISAVGTRTVIGRMLRAPRCPSWCSVTASQV